MLAKPFKTYRNQLTILRTRGLTVPTNGSPMRVLERENYYNVINGYKDLFLDKTSKSEKYKSGTHFNEIKALYEFDIEIKHIFLKRLLRIENNIKSLIAYNFAKAYKDKNCLSSENFELIPTSKNENAETRYSEVIKLLSSIQNEIARQIKQNNSIRHYMLEHGYVPLWVLMNILSFGKVSTFYKYMKQKEQQVVAKYYKLADTELGIMLKILSIVRNITAHDERLYNFKSKNSIRDNWVHKSLNIPIGQYGRIYGKNDLFAVLICIRALTNKQEIKKIVTELKREIHSLSKELNVITIDDILKEMGFPINWDDIAKI